MPYTIKRVIEADMVPDWNRTQPKWSELVEKVLSLKPNQSLEVEFDDPAQAARARDAVRDTANLQARAVIVRTRLVEKENGEATLFLIKVNPVPRSTRKEKSE